ncbi:DUF3050 domain-containing protein [Roseivirga sp. UBA838]|uniref:DUF3050 domain-containing protein n=1 Tax=Roseivirga sp. UBA838 TaxID=1947393 RepID=UPI00257CFC68|nr:DUF3050 domain-containing protein [Roseivirga sp. UBA838]|tara:strand:+ start:23027 stop:23818 length:792 start_codon:yes stop_codon:yes gene_type:complete
MEQTDWIERELQPYRTQLNNHPLYQRLSNLNDIQVFMENHVYAVWDFMSLLKALQNELTCTTLPWVPKYNPSLSRFINEIVLEEESDVNEDGEYMSHFEMYLQAMDQIGANTLPISQFIECVRAGQNLSEIQEKLNLNDAVVRFMRFTFDVIESGKPHLIASAFTFGREDLIPDMFLEIVKSAEAKDGHKAYSKLTYYLKRHIELDGGDHGPLAMRMITELCDNDEQKWQEVLAIAKKALNARIGLWDSISEAIGLKEAEPVL